MVTAIFQRIVGIIPVLFGVMVLSFVLVHLLPGDPVELMFGVHGVSPEEHARMLHQLGLDTSLPEQFVTYLGKVVTGDLGTSISSHDTVMSEFLARFPATVELALTSMILAILIGIPAGLIAAIKRGTKIDYTIMSVTLTGYSMPIFWWAMLAILLFSLKLNLLPVSGYIGSDFWIDNVTGFSLIDSLLSGDMDAFKSAISHIILPAGVLGTLLAASIARITRSAMLDVLNEDYIKVAKAKGNSPARVYLVHALRNALIPVVTVIGMQIGGLFGGAVLTETMFSWPGVGKWMLEAVNRRDYPVIQGGILIISTVIILTNLAVDLLYTVLNPRLQK